LAYSAKNIANALGAYLDHKPLTAAQAGIIQVAVAEFGNPPSGSFPIKTKSGNGNPPPKHGKAVKSALSNGTESLSVFARNHGNSAEQVIGLTESHHKPQAKFQTYIAKVNWGQPMPPGITLYYEVK
jgi:hypothetical protein